MNRAFRIVQFSDCHVSADPGALYRGVDSRRALESLLSAVANWRPDLLLATGDLSEDGSPESYRYLADLLRQYDVPTLVIAGNHDEPAVMRTFWPDLPEAGPSTSMHGEWRIIRLNSAVAGSPSGALSDRTLSELQGLLSDAQHALIALHHQPIAVGSQWIDRYPVEAGAKLLQRLVEAHPAVKAVLWGHVHSAFRQKREGVYWLGTPSTVANSRPFQVHFSHDPAGPACRWLTLHGDGRVRTGLLRA